MKTVIFTLIKLSIYQILYSTKLDVYGAQKSFLLEHLIFNSNFVAYFSDFYFDTGTNILLKGYQRKDGD